MIRFTYACLVVPEGRGGKRHFSSLTVKVNQAIDVNSHISYNDQSRLYGPLNSDRPAAPVDNIADRMSEKLEKGVVRGAIRLAASNDTRAIHNEKTLTILRLKHPPRRPASIATSFTLDLQ